MTQPASPYFAAIDLGSNSFHMLIVRIDGNTVEVIDREKQMVQIARGLGTDGALNEEAQERALICLHQFSERLRDIPSSHIRAVGTKTLRAAKNAKKFLKDAERVLGIKIQIISGYEEARLVYAGLANSISQSEQRLVVDIGGGSTEFIIGKNLKPLRLESLPLGCVSFTERYMRSKGLNSKSMRNVYLAACAELEEIRKNYLKTGWDVAYGTSGTMKAVAELLAPEDGGAVITHASLVALFDHTAKSGELDGSGIPKLRREVLPAGLAIVRAVMDQLKLEKIHVADASLKEGLIYDTLGRFDNRDARVETVEKLIEQYAIDRDQAQRVSDCALTLWSELNGPNLPGISRTKILRWAAQLHEIGLNISHSSYHQHGHYLLRHSDLAGFGRYEQYILATLVRLHRKKLSKSRTDGLDASARVAFVPLLICLRLAVLLHRRRENLDATPHIHVKDDVYSVHFPKGWLDEHPLTLASLIEEQSYLANIGVALSVE